MPFRSWQRDLDRDPNSEIARIARVDDERRPVAVVGFGVDLEEFCRAFLDGVIGDAGPFAAQDDALVACERALADRVRRPLSGSERTRVGIAFALAWNARAQRPGGASNLMRIAPRDTAERDTIPNAGWFHTSDGRYFASDADRRAHQRDLDEAGRRHAARCRARTGGDHSAA
jgi:hypothetical protein